MAFVHACMVSFILHMQERDKTGHALLLLPLATANTTRTMYSMLSAVALSDRV